MVIYWVPTAPAYAYDVIRGHACAYDAHGNRIPSTTRVCAHASSPTRPRFGSQVMRPTWAPSRPTLTTYLDEIYANNDPVNGTDPLGMCTLRSGVPRKWR